MFLKFTTLNEHRLPEMTYEDLQVFNAINDKLTKRGFKSRLSYPYVSGFHNGIVIEWGFEENIKHEAAKVNLLVSEEVEKLAID